MAVYLLRDRAEINDFGSLQTLSLFDEFKARNRLVVTFIPLWLMLKIQTLKNNKKMKTTVYFQFYYFPQFFWDK